MLYGQVTFCPETLQDTGSGLIIAAHSPGSTLQSTFLRKLVFYDDFHPIDTAESVGRICGLAQLP